MPTFNGPAFVAEALRRLDLADQAHHSAIDPHRAQHLRQTAAAFVGLADVAATLTAADPLGVDGELEAWDNALNQYQP